MGEFVLRLNYFPCAFRNRFRGLKKEDFKISIPRKRYLKVFSAKDTLRIKILCSVCKWYLKGKSNALTFHI